MDKKKLFTIGEVSKIKGFTIKALRFYERIGLIQPSYKDPLSSYRYYSVDQFIQLDIIKAMRNMGISPKDVKVILNRKDTPALLEFLDQKKEAIDRMLMELQKSKTIISMVQSQVSASLVSAANTECYYKDIPSRKLVTVKLESPKEEELTTYYSRLYNMLEEHKLTSTYETGILYTEKEGSLFYPSDVYNAVLEDSYQDHIELTIIPSGKYLCISYKMQSAAAQMEKFNQYIEQNHLKPKLILQADLLNDVFDESSSYLELQALIESVDQ